MDQAFQIALPLVGQIQLDIGTVLSAMIGFMFLIAGFDLVKLMLFPRWQASRFSSSADYWEDQARTVRTARDSHMKGSFEWDEQNKLYHRLLNRSTSMRMKGWR